MTDCETIATTNNLYPCTTRGAGRALNRSGAGQGSRESRSRITADAGRGSHEPKVVHRLKIPRFLDHHLAEDRSENEVKQAKDSIKEIIGCCINKDNGRKIVVDLENTRHIAKSCIKILAGFARDDPDFIMYHPNRVLYNRLLDNGFPKTNICSCEEKPAEYATCKES